MDMGSRHGIQVPSMRSMWYYSLTLNKRRPVHLVYLLFLHFIPATIIDGIALLLGKRPKYVV
jgi:fatty acyl-CoA reductase